MLAIVKEGSAIAVEDGLPKHNAHNGGDEQQGTDTDDNVHPKWQPFFLVTSALHVRYDGRL